MVELRHGRHCYIFCLESVIISVLLFSSAGWPRREMSCVHEAWLGEREGLVYLFACSKLLDLRYRRSCLS